MIAPGGKLDKHVVALGYCCPAAFLKLYAGKLPAEKQAVKARVSIRCIVENRMHFRNGEVRCLGRPTCLAGLFITTDEKHLF